MQRSSFVKLLLTAGAAITSPVTLAAKYLSGKRTGKGFMVAAGKDRNDHSISLMEGDTFFTKISTADTGGGMYLFESIRVKEGGPALHVHPEQDEWWYVLSGEFLIKVGEETYTAKAGDSVFGPRGVPHAFTKVGEGEARLQILYQPAGKMEHYFKTVSEGAMTKMTPAEQDAYREAHGFKRVGPPIGHLKQ
ncbi:Mannose-6-phosphate isomerase, cupin superfamily [Chitinophaga rupis]|uniref:Mannose-6-phosphate isomerase, cupin superfamily n=1 Tax=Chitinophaga rupis TaxID=573321 RepID=A0A1H8DNS7_9BACT|nr:cupin domain-containing protein [Chitinophaga rupis]SEN08899.1 Mannose-6-phosphate isomerase, cupin superfamily [Chitinophaga rupis]